MIVDVYIGTNKLELFNSEQIEIVQGIQDIRDITKTTTDYSKSFVVPATRINNKIFKHYYYIGLNGSFDARIKASGRIELGTTVYKEGYFILNQVTIKEGNPFSYSITFFGVLSGLSNLFGDILLGEIPIDGNDTTGQINYIAAEVKTLLTTPNSNLIYSMFSNKELIYSSGSTGTTNTDTQLNVAFTAPPTTTGVSYREFYPSIRVSRILTAIENQFNVKFIHIDVNPPQTQEPFLLSPDFEELYMLLLNPDIVQKGEGSKKNLISETIDLQRIETTGGEEWFKLVEDRMIVNPDYRGSNKWDKYDADITVTPNLSSMNIEYTLNRYVSFNGGAHVKQGDITGTGVLQEHSDYSDRAEGNYNVYWTITAPKGFTFSARIQLHYRFRHGLNHPINDRWYYCDDDLQIIGGNEPFYNKIAVNSLVPTIKIIEFLKGLISAFNLTLAFAYEQNGISFYYLETLNNYYANLAESVGGSENIKDFTKYADVRDYTITKTESTNEFLFKFQDPQTKLNMEFKSVNTLGYGDLLHTIVAYDANGLPFKTEGKRTVIDVPFEQVLYNRIPITTNEVNFGLPLQVGGLYDEEFSPVTVKPHLHYNTVSTFGDFGFIGDFGKELLPPTINMPHYSRAKLTNDTSGLEKSVFLFNKEGSTFDVQNVIVPTDPRPRFQYSLYSNFYETYIDGISNERVRVVNMKMRLPMREILQLKMNFIIKVGNNHYRINKVSTNLSTGISQFELITII